MSVQTMGNADAHDASACLAQLLRCAELGCDIYRLTVPDTGAVAVFAEVRRQSPIPIVADIHFDYRLALAALEAGADALRLNPGNIGGRDKVQAVARAAKAKGVPIRVGVNSGSLEKDETLVSSALKHVKMLEDEGFFDIVVSVKSSDVGETLSAYRALSEKRFAPTVNLRRRRTVRCISESPRREPRFPGRCALRSRSGFCWKKGWETRSACRSPTVRRRRSRRGLRYCAV